MRKREKYINFATSRMCSDDKTVNVYSSMVALVPHNECADGYFQLSKNHRCVKCTDSLGEACKQCEDYKGCIECISGHVLYYDDECSLWSCKPECAQDS